MKYLVTGIIHILMGIVFLSCLSSMSEQRKCIASLDSQLMLKQDVIIKQQEIILSLVQKINRLEAQDEAN